MVGVNSMMVMKSGDYAKTMRQASQLVATNKPAMLQQPSLFCSHMPNTCSPVTGTVSPAADWGCAHSPSRTDATPPRASACASGANHLTYPQASHSQQPGLDLTPRLLPSCWHQPSRTIKFTVHTQYPHCTPNGPRSTHNNHPQPPQRPIPTGPGQLVRC